MKLTPSQTKALSTERHLAITANAGSGKTRVLVKRYVDLFKKYPDLTTRNVAAITFTENAAAELRSRIIDEVSERLKDPDGIDAALRSRLRALRDSLPSAFIGTIHGFASRLLRAYPVEANIDASFAIVTGADQRLLAEDAIGIVFYSALEEGYQQTSENPTLHLFRTLGRYNVTNLVRALLSNRMRAATVQRNLLSKSDAEMLKFWQEEFERALSPVLSSDTKEFLNGVSQYLKSGKVGTDALEAMQAYFRSTGFFEEAAAFRNVVNKLITDKGTLRANVIDSKSAPSSIVDDVQTLIDDIIPLRPLLNACPKNEETYTAEHTEYIALLRTAFSLYDQVLLEYASTKNEYGLLDFDDLIEKLIGLLSNPELRSEISRDFRFLMIDEYQDTDESQFEIAKMLTESFGLSNNVAIVGDPKQAIYTFRNADADVFDRTRRAIGEQSLSDSAIKESVSLMLSPNEELGEIVLAESFRMTRSPLAAINLLFRDLMNESGYSELIQGRETQLQGRVEWICPPEPKRQKNLEIDNLETDETPIGEDDEASEVALIARKIQSIIQNDDSSYSVEVEHEVQNPTFGDIAILLRSRGNLRNLERSLNEANIPYIVSKGSGFFGQQEILDITSYLKFLASPTNDIALVATLRSPFFAVSDVELFQIAHHGAVTNRAAETPLTFWQLFQSFTESNNGPHLLRTKINFLKTLR